MSSSKALIDDNNKLFVVSDRNYFRQLLILGVLIFSATLFFIDKTMRVNRVAGVVEHHYIDIGSILIDGFILRQKEQALTADETPEAIVKLVGENVQHKKNNAVLIYEIVDVKENKEKIKTLIGQAEALFKADNLTSPVGNNALEKYEAVFLIDSDNVDAKTGIQKIVDRYLFFVESVIKKGEHYKVPGLIKNAYKAGYAYINMDPIVDKYRKYIADESIFIDFPKAPMAVVEEAEPVLMEESKEEHALADIDRDTALAALRLLERGDVESAISLLEEFSSRSDFWGESYNLLFSLYLNRGGYKQAEKLIYARQSLDVFFMAEKVARIFEAGNDYIAAINLLNGHHPSIEQYPDYYALKGALYYKMGQYKEAAMVYKGLLNYDYQNSRYWLGLAVSLETIDGDTSVAAFHYAKNYAGRDKEVQSYLAQRMPQMAI